MDTLVFDMNTRKVTLVDNNVPIDVEAIRLSKIDHLKNVCGQQAVYVNAPLYKQINVSLGVYEQSKCDFITNWIIACMKAIGEVEARLLAAVTVDDINAIDFSADTLVVRAQQIMISLGG